LKKAIDIFNRVVYIMIIVVFLNFWFGHTALGNNVGEVSLSVSCNETSQTPLPIAGAEIVMRDNYQLLAYKELMRISNLLITDPVTYMQKYNRIHSVYSKYIGKKTTIYDELSEEDIEYLQRCVESETHGATDFAAKVNIVNVIFNRARNEERFATTIKDVITTPGQFTYSKTTIDPLTVAACEYAYVNPDTTMGALYFHSGKQTSTFNGATYIFTDSIGHHFYGLEALSEE